MKKLLLLLFISNFSFAQNPLVKQLDYRFGGSDYDRLWSLQQTADGGYILGGHSNSVISGDKTQASQGYDDYWIVKTDTAGVKQWDTRFGGSYSDFLYSLQQTADGGYILGGDSKSGISGDKTQASQGFDDYWIVKTDADGVKQWDARFGGNDLDYLHSLQQTADGGYILGGTSFSGISGDKTQASQGNSDYWIVKTDSGGVKQWDARFGGSDGEALWFLQQTGDGGYILGGYSYSGVSGDKTQASQGSWDYWIVKTDASGIKQWDARFGGSDYDFLYSLQQTADGGYIMGGYSYSGISGDKTQASQGFYDYWIVKTDSLGNKQWDKDFGGTGDEDAFGNISQTADGGYLLAGTSYSPISGDKTENNLGEEQTWVVKTDSSGNKQWDKTIFTTGEDENGLAIQTSDGCYLMANYTSAGLGGDKTQASQGNYDYWIVKFCDTTGYYLTLPPTSLLSSSVSSLCQKFCIDFFDQSLNNPTSWQWSFEGGIPSSSTQQNPTNICYNEPGTYDVTLITTNANGNDTLILSNYITVYATPPFPTITQNGYTLTSSAASAYQWQLNTIDIAGATNQSYDVMQTGFYTVVISDSNGCVNVATQYVLISGIGDVKSDAGVAVYPNPSNGNFIVEVLNGLMSSDVTISVVNTLGQTIYSSHENISLHVKKEIQLHDVADGIYFLEVTSDDIFPMQKIMISK